MNSRLKTNLVVCVMVAWISVEFGKVAAATEECTPIIVRVKAQYFEQALVKDSKYRVTTRNSDDFLRVYKESKRASGAEVSVGVAPMVNGKSGPKLFGMSAGGNSLFNDVIDTTSQNSTRFTQKSKDETVFNPDFTQIVEKITKEVRIGRDRSSKITTNVRDSASIQNSESQKQLNLRAREYIYNNYGHETGQIRAQTGNSNCTADSSVCMYEERACIPKQEDQKLSTDACTPVRIRVTAEFDQQAMISDYNRVEVTKSSKRMKHAMTRLQDDKDGKAGIDILGISLSASAYDKLLDVDDIKITTEREFTEINEDLKVYNEKFLQVIQRIKTEVSISDMVGTTIVSTWRDSVPVTHPETKEELDNRARQYIINNFGGEMGQIIGETGHIYEESTCLKMEIPEPKGICESDGDCPLLESCINQNCKSPCAVPANPCGILETCHVRHHKPACKCILGYKKNENGQCIKIKQPPGHCLPHQHCKAGDCCALGSSCRTCPNGSMMNFRECSGKGNYRCNEE